MLFWFMPPLSINGMACGNYAGRRGEGKVRFRCCGKVEFGSSPLLWIEMKRMAHGLSWGCRGCGGRGWEARARTEKLQIRGVFISRCEMR